METLYTNSLFTIAHYQQLNALCFDWSQCVNKQDYLSGLKTFNYYFKKTEPRNTYWGNQHLNIYLDKVLQERTKDILKEQASLQGDCGKTAIVTSEKDSSRTIITHITNHYNLKHFKQKEAAFKWFAAEDDFNTKEHSQIKINELNNNEYELQLKLKKADYKDYLNIINQIMGMREFCLKNLAHFNMLTSREKEILNLIIKGFKNCEIAEYLFLSIETIKTHRKNIMHKLSCDSCYELSNYAILLR